MKATRGNVIYLYQRDPQEALERLNRITGLRFSCWPQSLVPPSCTTLDAPLDTALVECLVLAFDAEPAEILLG